MSLTDFNNITKNEMKYQVIIGLDNVLSRVLLQPTD